jgi:hypothetical protein
MSEDMKTPYGQNFYQKAAAGISTSAAIILEHIYKLFNPIAVID